MIKAFNKNHLLDILKLKKKAEPKSLFYDWVNFLVLAKHYGLLEKWIAELNFTEMQELIHNEKYLDKEFKNEM